MRACETGLERSRGWFPKCRTAWQQLTADVDRLDSSARLLLVRGPCVPAFTISSMTGLVTARMVLRRWRKTDREPFARMNADPMVMEYFPAPLTRAESDSIIDNIEGRFADRGYSLWAAELRASREFIGFVGLSVPAFQAHFTPCVEIGWR